MTKRKSINVPSLSPQEKLALTFVDAVVGLRCQANKDYQSKDIREEYNELADLLELIARGLERSQW